MKKIILLLLGIVFTACTSTKTLESKKALDYDKLLVNYSSNGCFHHINYQFSFVKNKVLASEKIAQWKKDWNSEDAFNELGSLTLSDLDMKGLDNLLDFYKTNKKTGCTTKNHIEYKYFKAGKLIKSTEYLDASCTNDTSLFTFPELANRLKLKNK